MTLKPLYKRNNIGSHGIHSDFRVKSGISHKCGCSLKELVPWPWAVWLSWLEHHPINQKVAGSTMGQGTFV